MCDETVAESVTASSLALPNWIRKGIPPRRRPLSSKRLVLVLYVVAYVVAYVVLVGVCYECWLILLVLHLVLVLLRTLHPVRVCVVIFLGFMIFHHEHAR